MVLNRLQEEVARAQGWTNLQRISYTLYGVSPVDLQAHRVKDWPVSWGDACDLLDEMEQAGKPYEYDELEKLAAAQAISVPMAVCREYIAWKDALKTAARTMYHPGPAIPRSNDWE